MVNYYKSSYGPLENSKKKERIRALFLIHFINLPEQNQGVLVFRWPS